MKPTISRRLFLASTLLSSVGGSLHQTPALADPLSAPQTPPTIPQPDPDLDAWAISSLRTKTSRHEAPLFHSFFSGGFECSTHIYHGRRLDLTGATQHDRFAKSDYERLRTVGMRGARDGVSWPLSEPKEGRFDFSRARSMARAAHEAGIRVAWDYMHFGWPLHVDVFATSFPKRFRRYAREATRALLDEGAGPEIVVSPINEISFLAWAAGDKAFIYPEQTDRAPELKLQLVRAVLEGMDEIKKVAPRARFLHCDPLINVTPRSDKPRELETAEYLRSLMFQAWDMIAGRTWRPHLGGAPELLDIIGVNYYRDNQRFTDGELVDGNDHRYRPLSSMLEEIVTRYNRPILLAETGAEGPDRSKWLRYVASETRKALQKSCPILGVTWYPIVNHPGWKDDRHVHNGLWDYPDATGHRQRHEPLATEISSFELPLRRLRNHAYASSLLRGSLME